MELARKRGENEKWEKRVISKSGSRHEFLRPSISPYVMMILKKTFTKKEKDKIAGLLSSGCKGFFFYISPSDFYFIASIGFSGRAKKKTLPELKNLILRRCRGDDPSKNLTPLWEVWWMILLLTLPLADEGLLTTRASRRRWRGFSGGKLGWRIGEECDRQVALDEKVQQTPVSLSLSPSLSLSFFPFSLFLSLFLALSLRVAGFVEK